MQAKLGQMPTRWNPIWNYTDFTFETQHAGNIVLRQENSTTCQETSYG